MLKAHQISLEDWCKMYNKDHAKYLLNPEDAHKYSHSSTQKVKWKCAKGHIFEGAIYRKVKLAKFSCPVCSGHKILKGFNDLASQRPDIAKDWDYANNELKPDEVTVGSSKYVNWLCDICNKTYNMRISARTYTNQGCPKCKRNSTSLPEQILYLYVKKHFPDALNRNKLHGVEYDILIPSIKIAIEYDSSYWHKNKDTNYKFKHAELQGYTLYVLTGLTLDTKDNRIFVIDDKHLYLSSVNNNLVEGMKKLFKQAFGSIEDFEDYTDVYKMALDTSSNIKKQGPKLPEQLDFVWSSLNNYPLSQAHFDEVPKAWQCIKAGHTFYRKLEDIKYKHRTTCPICKGYISPQFYLLAYKTNFIILDIKSGDIEEISYNMLLEGLQKGLNIRGVSYIDNQIVTDLSYLYELLDYSKYNSFKRLFNSFYFSLDFKGQTDSPICTKIAEELNNLFHSDNALLRIQQTLKYLITNYNKVDS